MMVTQKDVVLKALERGEVLTAEMGRKKYQIRFLSHVVSQLRRMGYEIHLSRSGKYSMPSPKKEWFGVEVR